MKRRHFLKLAPAALLPLASGCAIWRVDPLHVLVRSPYIGSLKKEQEILDRARLMRTDDGKIRVLFVQGTAYERGYQHGVLLREEVNDNLGYIYDKALDKFYFEELFAEVYERMRPYIPQEYIEEMHGLAHGARMPLHVIHHLHILPSLGEWGGKKKLKKVIKKMMRGEDLDTVDLGTSCSNLSVINRASKDSQLYAVRILDWGLHRISKLHKYPLITIAVPDKGYASCNIGWVGFLGAVSGMNEHGITLGEMGYGNPPNEVLNGTPMIFLLRDVLSYTSNLEQIRKRISQAPGTASFAYLMTDGKTGEAQLYVRDRDRFLVFEPGVDLRDKEDFYPAISDTLYGGHYGEVMTELLNKYHGEHTPERFMEELIPKMAMKHNFQNVIYDPKNLRFWVNNARSREINAKHEPYTLFDFGRALKEFKATK